MSSAHQRLAALRAFVGRETDDNADFDRIMRLAADLFDTPIAVIALLGDRGAVIGASLGIAGDRLQSFNRICAQVIDLCEDGIFVLEDAGRPTGLVHDQPWGMFAAVALTTKDGLRLGMLCVADTRPRPKPAPRSLDRLRLLADLVVDAIELRHARHESETSRRLMALAESLGGIGHWRYDLRRRDLTWSDEVYRIYGVSRDSYRPDFAATMTFCHADDRPGFERQIRQAIEDTRNYVSARRIVRADGSTRHVVSRGSVECDRQGAVTALFGVVQDVTERAETIMALQESEARYRLLIEQATDIILSLDLNGRITFASASLAAILGYRPDEIIGLDPQGFIHPRDRRKLRISFAAMLRRSIPRLAKPIEFQARHQDGRWLWLESHPALVLDSAQASATGWTDIIRNIERRKAQQAEIAAAHRAEDAAAQAKSELLADLSHEIRTPLNAIIGFADLLALDSTLTREQRQKVLRIHAAGQGLLTLANDVLHLSKLEAGHIRLEQRPFSPLALVREAAALIRLEADRKRLALVVDVPRIFDMLLIGDPDRIHRILLNLLSNAIKFTDRGEVRIGLDAEPAGSSMRIAISVRDSGRGIAADQLPRLFRRYAQAEDSVSARTEGSGLGLAISKRLVEAMNGSITVQSRLDAGSCFVVSLTLPLAEAPAAVEAPATFEAPERSLEPGCAGALRGLRILVAEDVPINQRLVHLLLEPLGCMIDFVRNGADALEAVQRETYALVLMDVRMPVMDGIEASRRIRSLGGGFALLPIVAMTANNFPEEIERCRAAGMSDHVVKPFAPGKLTATVVDWTMGSAVGVADRFRRNMLSLVGP